MLRELLPLFTSLGFGAFVGAIGTLLLLRFFLPAYLNEKGKNLATREDIGAITREVERVRVEYGALLEELKARHQLRLAAIDRRLNAHQEAFILWRSLMTGVEESGKAIMACQEWWEKNCLYLDPRVREAFVVAYTNAHLRAEFVRVHADATYITEAWDKVKAFPETLFAAVQLPGLSELETMALQERPKAPITHHSSLQSNSDT